MPPQKPSLKNKEKKVPDEFIRLMFERHAAIMLLIDPGTGEIIDANQAAVDFYGYSKSKLCTMLIDDINTLPPEQITAERQKAATEMRNHFIFRHRLAGGEERIVEVHSSPIPFQDKQFLFSIIHDVTERRQLEENLLKWEQAFKNARWGIVTSSPDGRSLAMMNPAFAQMHGYSINELTGEPVIDIFAPDCRAEVAEQIRIADEKNSHSFESLHIHKDGSVFPVEVNISIVRNSAGDFLYRAVNVQDITRRKQAEAELIKSKARFRRIIDASPVPMALNDGSQNVTYLNPAFIQTFGYTIEDIPTLKEWWGKAYPDHEYREWVTATRQARLEEAKRSEEGFMPLELKVRCKDGTDKIVMVSTTPISDGIEESNLVIFYDVSELRKKDEALRESEERYRLLVSTIPEPIFLHQDGRFIFANQAALGLFGAAKTEDLIGMPVMELLHPDHRQNMSARMKRYLSEKIQAAPISEEKFIRFDGTSIDVEVIGNRLMIGGKPTVQVIAHDITKRKKMEDALRASEQKYRILFDTLNEGIALNEIVYDENGEMIDYRILEVNQAFYSIADYTGKIVGGLATKLYNMPLETIQSFWHKHKHRTTTQLTEFTSPINGRHFIISTSPFVNDRFVTSFFDITERKQAEEELHKSRANLDAVFNATDESIFLLNVDETLLALNNVASQRMGQPRENLIGHKVYDLLPPEVVKSRRPFIDRALLNGEHVVFEDMRNGRHMLNQLFPILNSDGQVERLAIFSRDITESKLAKIALQESEQKHRRLFESMSQGVIYYNENGKIISVNPAAERILGLSTDQLLGQTFQNPAWKIINENGVDLPWELHPITIAMNTGKSVEHGNLGIFNPDTERYLWLSITAIPLFRPEETKPYQIYSTFEDITDRKLAESELRKQRDFATQIINVMGQGLTVTDADGRFEFVNPAYARMFGYETNDLIGQRPRDITTPQEHGVLEEQREQRRSGKTTTYESQLVRADGSIASVLVTGVPRKIDGKPAGAIAVITDLTEQKRIENELRSAKDLLEKALAREERLANTDALTGINNRRHLFVLAKRKFAVASRYKQPLAALMFDIDLYKQINDEYGHGIGDQTLIKVVQTVSSELRDADQFGRYGGDEFIILLPMTAAPQAYLLAERIRTKVETLRIPSAKGDISITLSIGVVEIDHASSEETLENIFRRADKAMYQAKQSGRNRTVVFGT